MILGLGSDIVNISRIENIIDKFGDKFINRSYMAEEISASDKFNTENKKGRAAYFARRFAAKEAFAKAVGTGFRDGLRFEHIGVVNDENGKPSLLLKGRAKEMIGRLSDKEGGTVLAHVTLSDDYPMAQAMVIIEKV